MNDEGTVTAVMASEPVQMAVLFQDYGRMQHPRRYWLSWLIGWICGPILMATFRPKNARFGVTRNGNFKWIEVDWK